MPDKIGVFVSHHHSPEEDAFTARLVADLQAAGADVWVDYQGIASGSFVAKISQGLAARQWLVLVMTPASLASQWVQLEVDTAIAEQRAGRMLGVVPFVMLPCKDTDIPHLWRTFRRYDATNGYESARDGLLSALGVSLPASKGSPQSQHLDENRKQDSVDETAPKAQVGQNNSKSDLERLKTLEKLRALSAQQFVNAVMRMLKANGYSDVRRPERRPPNSDLECKSPDGRVTYVWCVQYVLTSTDVGYLVSPHSRPYPTNHLALVVTIAPLTNGALATVKRDFDLIKVIDRWQVADMMQRFLPQ